MFNEQKLYALVARELRSLSCEQVPADNRGIESAPYARHASPMARYQPMIRLLDDADWQPLNLRGAEVSAFRGERRRIYRGYVSDLKRVVEDLLAEHAQSGVITLDALKEESRRARNCLRQLRRHAWWHWVGVDGVGEMVAQTIKDLTVALRLGELVVMPLPAQAIA